MDEHRFQQWRLDFLSVVNCFPANNQFVNWQEAGIRHGFIGVSQNSRAQDFWHVHQVHGTKILDLGDTSDTSKDQIDSIQADGLTITKQSQAIAVKTADCLPILIFHPHRVWAVHAGWRGLAAGMLQEALQSMVLHGCQDSVARFGIGPAIGMQRFEIGPEVVEGFLSSERPVAEDALLFALQKGERDRWFLDLQWLACFILQDAGISPTQISVMRSCTYDDPKWHSYRRDGQKSGRNLSWIACG